MYMYVCFTFIKPLDWNDRLKIENAGVGHK